jgi:hypothetical protein
VLPSNQALGKTLITLTTAAHANGSRRRLTGSTEQTEVAARSDLSCRPTASAYPLRTAACVLEYTQWQTSRETERMTVVLYYCRGVLIIYM